MCQTDEHFIFPKSSSEEYTHSAANELFDEVVTGSSRLCGQCWCKADTMIMKEVRQRLVISSHNSESLFAELSVCSSHPC